jgi:hypothetical protein
MKITHLLVFHEEELFTENSQREFLSIAGWSSPVARQAHNLKVVGSNPTPATRTQPLETVQFLGVFLCLD